MARAKSPEAPSPNGGGPDEFDVFFICPVADAPAAHELCEQLARHSVRAWLAAENGLNASRWKIDALEMLKRLPAAALVVGRSGLPGEWGRRELDEAARRKHGDPAFRFLLIYLPDAEPIVAEALPVAPDTVVTLAGASDPAALDAIATAVKGDAPRGRPSTPASGSVKNATNVPGPVTAFQVTRRLLELHPEYGGGKLAGSDVGDGSPSASRRTTAEWLSDVASLYDERRLDRVHGRLMIDGLARLDGELQDTLRKNGFLEELRSEIQPNPDELVRSKRDSVETFADQPADVDELGRSVIAEILARRIRRVRLNEQERAKDQAHDLKRGGPFLLHVYGRWGAGKTSLLRFLRRQLEAGIWAADTAQDRRTYATAARDAFRRWRTGADARADELGGDVLKRWIVVEFNGWQHQRIVPPWWWLMAAVTSQGSQALRRIDRPRWIRLKIWDYRWRARGAMPGVLMVAAGLVIGWLVWKSGKVSVETGFWPSLMSATEGVAKSLSVIVALVLTLWGGAKALSRWLLVGSPRAAQQVLRHGTDPLGALSERFQEIVLRLHYPLAIFIDDLDRCTDRYVVELLEGIQTLFKDVPVTYVVAADRDWICQSFALQYSGFCEAVGQPGRPLGHLFLEKTFQLSVPIPALTDGTRMSYLQQLLTAGNGNGAQALDQARREAQKRLQGLTNREEIDAELRQSAASPVEQQAVAEAAVLRLAEPELERQTEHMLEPFASLLERNPRSMKRLLNAYGMARAQEILRVAGAETNGHRTVSPEELALWTILDLRWPLLADHLAMRPDVADAIVADDDPPEDAPEWLKQLWRDDDVKDVLTGNATGVNASLKAATITTRWRT